MKKYVITFLIILLLTALTGKIFDIFLKKHYGLGDPVLYEDSKIVGYKIKPSQKLKRLGNNIYINPMGMRSNSEWDYDNDNFKLAEPYLKIFCKDYFYFGPVGMGAKSKLLNNFLSLGNAALVNNLAKTAIELDLDLKKVFDVAKLGSGNSTALVRVFDNLLKGDFTGFKFTATNSVKDLTYIQDLLKDFPEAEKVAKVNKNYFQKAVDDGYGENFISELINKN